MAREYNISFDSCKTYMTREGVKKAVDKTSIPDTCRYIVVMTPDGRFTPIFFHVEPEHLYGAIVHMGFHVIG